MVDFGPRNGRPVLMGVSPDGGSILLGTADLQRLVPGEVAIYDIASGKSRNIQGTAMTFTVAGAFSPDGSLVALVTTDELPEGGSGPGSSRMGGGYDLKLASANGSTSPRSVADAAGSALHGPLTWTPSNWITSAPQITPRPSAWTLD